MSGIASSTAQVGGREVHLEYPPPRVGVFVGDRAPAGDPRRVHEHLDGPLALAHLGERGRDRAFVGDVAPDDAGLLAEIETENRVAERAEPVHHSDADRTGAPRHDDAAAQWSTFGVDGSADHSVQEPS